MASTGSVLDRLWEASAAGGPAFVAGVRSLSRSDRRMLLQRAEMAPEDADHARRLSHVLVAVAPDFDPLDAGDARRIRRMLDEGTASEPDLEPLMRRAANGAADADLVQRARLVCGQWCVVRDRLDEAERWYRAVLESTRGSGSRVEGMVTASFARLCMGARRDVEAMVLARRAAGLLELCGDVFGVAFSLAVLAHTLAAIDDWDRLEPLLEELEAAAPGTPASRRGAIELSSAICRVQLCVARGRSEEALVFAERSASLAAEIKSPVWTSRSGPLLRIPALVAAGLDGEAADEAEAALRLGDPGDEQGLRLLAHRVEIGARRGERGIARRARRWIGLLEGAAGVKFGPGRRLESAQRVADELRRADIAADVARRAYDVAAAAALERLAQLDRFARDFPDVATPAADDRATLDDLRARTAARRANLLVAVARLLEAEARAGRHPLAVLASDGGLVRTCAWCGSVRARDGMWMPMPELLPLLPDSTPIGVTHGICEGCMPAVAAQLRVPRAADRT